jgi:hypothetical protein
VAARGAALTGGAELAPASASLAARGASLAGSAELTVGVGVTQGVGVAFGGVASLWADGGATVTVGASLSGSGEFRPAGVGRTRVIDLSRLFPTRVEVALYRTSAEGLAIDAEVSPVDLRSVVEGLALTADAGGVSFPTRIL